MTTVVQRADNPALAVQMATGAIPPGYVRLTCGDPQFADVVLLGPEPYTVTGGLGGWEVIGRPRDVGMTIWDGVDPYGLSLSLMFDGWREGIKQERTIRALMRVARGDRESPPGVLRVEGIPIPAQLWVIEGIEFGDPIRAPHGYRWRQALTLNLREYIPPTYLRRRKSPQSSSTKTIIVQAKHGDTPAKIAKRRRLKSWTVIRDLNRKTIKTANQALKPGQKVRVPSTKQAARTGGKDRK